MAETPFDLQVQMTTIILDLRDRMARIETKLDGHQDQHVAIDKRFEALEDTVNDHNEVITTFKTRVATLSAVASAIIALLVFVGEHVWQLLAH